MSKEAMKLALKALEHLQPTALTSFYTIGDRNKAITALREALAQPQQEPVAALQRVMTRLADLLDEDQFAEIEGIVARSGVAPPAQRKPLADEEKLALLKKHFNAVCVPEWFDALLLDIEAAYNIKEKNT